MVRPFKVFAHLIDAEDKIWAQHDAPPGEGCCPANTWAEGEVIVDPHPMVLGTDLPTGTYQLVVGMYDQESEARVPAYDDAGNQLARDRVQIREIVIEPGAASGQEVLQPEFGFDYRVLLPLVTKGQSSK